MTDPERTGSLSIFCACEPAQSTAGIFPKLSFKDILQAAGPLKVDQRVRLNSIAETLIKYLDEKLKNIDQAQKSSFNEIEGVCKNEAFYILSVLTRKMNSHFAGALHLPRSNSKGFIGNGFIIFQLKKNEKVMNFNLCYHTDIEVINVPPLFRRKSQIILMAFMGFEPTPGHGFCEMEKYDIHDTAATLNNYFNNWRSYSADLFPKDGNFTEVNNPEKTKNLSNNNNASSVKTNDNSNDNSLQSEFVLIKEKNAKLETELKEANDTIIKHIETHRELMEENDKLKLEILTSQEPKIVKLQSVVRMFAERNTLHQLKVEKENQLKIEAKISEAFQNKDFASLSVLASFAEKKQWSEASKYIDGDKNNNKKLQS